MDSRCRAFWLGLPGLSERFPDIRQPLWKRRICSGGGKIVTECFSPNYRGFSAERNVLTSFPGWVDEALLLFSSSSSPLRLGVSRLIALERRGSRILAALRDLQRRASLAAGRTGKR